MLAAVLESVDGGWFGKPQTYAEVEQSAVSLAIRVRRQR